MKNIKDDLFELIKLIKEFEKEIPLLIRISDEVARALKKGKKILICGNGGSAAESQHMAAELVVRFQRERKALSALALTTDTSIITAMSNDYSFEDIFSRQVEALGREGDILFGFSTSGNSRNIVKAFKTAKTLGLKTVAICGQGGKIQELGDYVFKVNSSVTARIQEVHLIFIHILCEILEDRFVR